jgi:hypothetical protein
MINRWNLRIHGISGHRWLMFVILAFGRLRLGGLWLEASLDK